MTKKRCLFLLLLIEAAWSSVDIDLQNHWDGGFNGQATIPIMQDMNGWKIHLVFDSGVNTLETSEGTVQKLSDTEFSISSQSFNAHPSAGSTLNVNFLGQTVGDKHLHVCVYMEGLETGVCTNPQASIVPPTSPTVGATVCYTLNPTLYTSPSTPATQTQTTPTATPQSLSSTSSITNSSGAAVSTEAVSIPDSASTEIGSSFEPLSTKSSLMDSTIAATNATSTSGSCKDYGDALAKSILFYDAQRSGKLPANNPIPWRGDSALDDCVVGGWYDAGDHVKFGLPFGASAHLLLWGLHDFKAGYEQSGQLDQAYDMIKWATDYMLAAWDNGTQQLVAQIGEGNADHSYWGRPEDMTMTRPCYKLSADKPGSDIAGEWAAALAAASLVFKDKGDTAYANQLVSAAEQIYAFGKSHLTTYTNSVPGVSSFYSSSGYKDEMCEGGVWLYRATGDPQYLSDAVLNFHEADHAWALSWDDKKVACQLLLYEETNDNQYKTEVQGFLKDWMPGGSVAYTPCGLAWRDKWGANRYAGNAAFVALAAAEAGINTEEYRTWALEQINYLLGDNNHDGGCFSYQIGVCSMYPKSPHHRAASCPSPPETCSEANLHSPGPSPHLLLGALVGGPDGSDNYQDNREDYVMNEVAIDYNSGFQSALAAINQLKGSTPATNNKCPCNG